MIILIVGMSQAPAGSGARRKRLRQQQEFDFVSQQVTIVLIQHDVPEIPVEGATTKDIFGDYDTPHIILRFGLGLAEREIYDMIKDVHLLYARLGFFGYVG